MQCNAIVMFLANEHLDRLLYKLDNDLSKYPNHYNTIVIFLANEHLNRLLFDSLQFTVQL